MINKVLTFVQAVICCLFVSCQKEPDTIAVTGITLSQTSVEITEGESTHISATISPSNATNKTVIWSSDNPFVTVSDGTITGTKPCSATVTAKSDDGGKTASCSVRVVARVIHVASVSLDNTSLTMTEGDTQALTVTISPSEATDPSVIWSSDNESVATVSSLGVVSAKAPGKATISVKSNDGGKVATCSVTVQAKIIAVTGVSLDETSLTMTEGDTHTLTATVSPTDATDKTVTWSSSNSSVAEVSSSGVVIAKTAGNATITVKTTDGGKTATCAVSVKAKVISVTGVSLDKTSLTMTEGDTQTLTATVTPSNATDKSVTWSSSALSVAEVSSSGVVIAKSAGSATITVRTTDGGKTASCYVVVNKKVIPVSSVSLNKTSLTLTKGQSETLTATVSPSDATDKTISWSSSNTSVAAVDQNGKVTAVGGGSATITAKAGDKQATCTVTVTVPVNSVSLDRTSVELTEGGSTTLVATVKPDDATDKTVTWSSANTSVATVDQNGKVTAIKEGSTNITAKAGDKTATCKVTVKQKPYVTSLSLSENSFNGYINKYYSVSVAITPSDAQYDLEWTSSDERVAAIQGSGLSRTIYTKDFGVTNITVKDKISGKSVSITVSTIVTDFSWKENTGSTYSGYPLITIEVGDEYQLHYSCNPSSATHLFEDLTNFVFYEPSYVVDAPSVISINSEGKVTGVKVGTIGIKPTGRIIKGSSGNDRVYFTVKAKTIAVSDVRLNKTSLSLNVGSFETLTATVVPDNATNKTVTWTSSNNSVATVDNNGKVTAVAGGSATITAKAGDKQATCAVTVTVPVASVSLNKTTLTLTKGQSETLTATVNPSNATDKKVTWSSSNTSVASVDQNGKVTAIIIGAATITAKNGDKQAICTVTVKEAGPDAIDLGLSVKWASFNVGATSPEGYGKYFAWGETATKSSFSWGNYTFRTSGSTYSDLKFSKYNSLSGYGTVDKKTVLDLSDDVARKEWGGSWRMPTQAEFDELSDNCTWEYTSINGVFGQKLTSKVPGYTDKWIFLPAAGRRDGSNSVNVGSRGYYWTSSHAVSWADKAYEQFFNSSDKYITILERYFGLTVRPVCPKK